MLKKLLLLSFAAFALAACNDEADEGIQYATSNPEIVDGVYSGQTMHFYGTATVTNTKDNSTYSDPEAWFEIHGDKGLVIYMHQTRFAPDMPGQEMRIYRMPYTGGEGATLTFSAESFIPQAKLPNETGGYDYQDFTQFMLTEIEGTIDGTLFRMAFTCMGIYRMEYEGRLLVKK